MLCMPLILMSVIFLLRSIFYAGLPETDDMRLFFEDADPNQQNAVDSGHDDDPMLDAMPTKTDAEVASIMASFSDKDVGEERQLGDDHIAGAACAYNLRCLICKSCDIYIYI